MRTVYFDCVNGAAGDMINAALLDAGADEAAYRAALATLKLDGYELKITQVNKQGFAARRFDVHLPRAHDYEDTFTFDPSKHGRHHHAPGRHLKDVLAIVQGSGLSAGVKQKAEAVFTRLAEAEAKVHGTSIEKVHFHEVGAVDALVDVCGACLALELLGIERVVSSPIPVGSGTVKCAHGILPIPAPAVLHLLTDKPLAASPETGELATPTGAALLTVLSDSFGPLPSGRVRSVGVGAGGREGKTRPNILRAIVLDEGEPPLAGEADDLERDAAVVLETNLDDATGEQIGLAVERMLAAGALDVWTTPITMKKGRPGVVLSVLAAEGDAERMEALFFEYTPTFGVRRYAVRRGKLRREVVTVETRFGPIRVKRGLRQEAVIRSKPEYEDCRRAAEAAGVTLETVRREVEMTHAETLRHRGE